MLAISAIKKVHSRHAHGSCDIKRMHKLAILTAGAFPDCWPKTKNECTYDTHLGAVEEEGGSPMLPLR